MTQNKKKLQINVKLDFSDELKDPNYHWLEDLKLDESFFYQNQSEWEMAIKDMCKEDFPKLVRKYSCVDDVSFELESIEQRPGCWEITAIIAATGESIQDFILSSYPEFIRDLVIQSTICFGRKIFHVLRNKLLNHKNNNIEIFSDKIILCCKQNTKIVLDNYKKAFNITVKIIEAF